MEDELPTRLGRFEIRGRLGEGGMGRVYLARDPALGREVAIKVLRPEIDDPTRPLQAEIARQRLAREAQAMARLAHPNVIAVFEVGRDGDDVFVVMERVAGGTLTQWLATPRAWDAVARAIAQVADGLAAAHAGGLVHRDIKPDNILVGEDGRLRLTDFGLVGMAERPEGVAVAIDDDEGGPDSAPPPLTHAGGRVGTLGYMAPEQLEGGGADARSDQFALCVTLFEALHGTKPFAGATYRALVAAVLAGEIAPVATRGVPEALVRAVRRGLACDPADRWPDVAALATELRRIADAPSARRPRTGPIALGAVAVLAAGGWWFARASDEGPVVAPVPVPAPARPAGRSAPRVAIDRGACEASPAFLDDDHLVYTHGTEAGVDLWQRDLVTGADRALTATPDLDETTPTISQGDRSITMMVTRHGAPGGWLERLDPDDLTRTPYPLPSLFLAAGGVRIGDDLYYVVGDGGTVGRLRDGAAGEVTKVPNSFVFAIVPSGDGQHLGLRIGNRACVVDLPRGEPVCTPDASIGPVVPDHDASHLYFGTARGLVRHDRAAARDDVIVADAGPAAGIALAPSGARIAWSDCLPSIALTDLDASPPRVIHDESLTSPSSNGRGGWAFMRETASTTTLAFRDDHGLVHLLTDPLIQTPQTPMVEPGGERIVFGMAEVRGLHLAWGVRQRAFERITDGNDLFPVWLGDRRLAFTRAAEDNVPSVWIVDLDSRAAHQALAAHRMTVDAQPDGALVLLFNEDRTRLYLWDPVRGTEREVAQPTELARVPMIDARLAPDGASVVVQRGANAELWRYDVDGTHARKVYAPPVGHGLWGVDFEGDHLVIGDGRSRGRIYVADLP
ncbi:MAG: serine/threonine protein kinase [Deltaproteobacteria bacterium]|nr:serine/threonine protein kinase [Deltaproteobacteria bacterium]